MNKKLEGKKVVLLGGSRGIGKAVVLELAKHGAHILFTYASNEKEAKATEAEAQKINPYVKAMKADITKNEDINKVFDFVPANFGGKVDIYLGIAFPTSQFVPTVYMTEEKYDSMFSAVRGHYFATQKAAQSLNNGGRIIVFSSAVRLLWLRLQAGRTVGQNLRLNVLHCLYQKKLAISKLRSMLFHQALRKPMDWLHPKK